MLAGGCRNVGFNMLQTVDLASRWGRVHGSAELELWARLSWSLRGLNLFLGLTRDFVRTGVLDFVMGYCLPPLRGWGLGSVESCSTGELSLDFHLSNVKGSGQECPLHTRSVELRSAAQPGLLSPRELRYWLRSWCQASLYWANLEFWRWGESITWIRPSKAAVGMMYHTSASIT